LINKLFEIGAGKATPRPYSASDIESARTIFFALFTRYGDTIIDIKVIRELISRHPDKSYTAFAPRQMIPYLNELTPEIRVIPFNKRNLFDLIRGLSYLIFNQPDIGFNPWSQGHESCYLISRCRRYSCFKSHPLTYDMNIYERARLYMELQATHWHLQNINLASDYRNILICPQTTNPDKDLDGDLLDHTIRELKKAFPQAALTIAAMHERYMREGCQTFLFRKKAESSRSFIDLMNGSDLVVCADSAPMHLAQITGKDNIAMFFATRPELVLDAGARSRLLDMDKQDISASKEVITRVFE
jgi:ADP-heptose:LPS heptosyltransferase